MDGAIHVLLTPLPDMSGVRAGRQQWNNDRWMAAIMESLAGVQLEPRVWDFLHTASATAGAPGRVAPMAGDEAQGAPRAHLPQYMGL